MLRHKRTAGEPAGWETSMAVGIGSLVVDLWPQLTIGSNQIRGWLRYNRDIFDAGTAEHIASTFTGLVARMAREPGTSIGKLL
jgi:hypothetical protein